jgi:hypothetical protein
MVRHFDARKGRKQGRPLRRPVQRGRRKKERGGEGAGRRIRQRPTRSARSRVSAHIGVRPSSREIRLEEGTNQSSEPAKRWDRERAPCETDHVTRAEFRRLGGPAGHGEGQRAVTNKVEGKTQ